MEGIRTGTLRALSGCLCFPQRSSSCSPPAKGPPPETLGAPRDPVSSIGSPTRSGPLRESPFRHLHGAHRRLRSGPPPDRRCLPHGPLEEGADRVPHAGHHRGHDVPEKWGQVGEVPEGPRGGGCRRTLAGSQREARAEPHMGTRWACAAPLSVKVVESYSQELPNCTHSTLLSH